MHVYLDESKSFYKANMHCHSTGSDGRATPEQIKEEYMKRGYSVVAYTDHDHITDCTHLTDESFIAITGYELDVTDPAIPWDSFTRQVVHTMHMNFYAIEPHNLTTLCMSAEADSKGPEEVRAKVKYDGRADMRVWSPEGISRIVDYAHERGFLVCYNHPVWSLEYEAQYLNYGDLDFVEVFNTGCYRNGFDGYEQIFDVMIKNGKHVAAIAADDNHNIHGFEGTRTDSFGGWIMINADKLDYGEIMKALREHRFYASTGPEIYSITREGNLITVKTSPARRIAKQTEGRQVGVKFAEEGKTLTEATFKVRENERFFRITVEDDRGMRAYSQLYPGRDDAGKL